jgi:hypothetical protein
MTTFEQKHCDQCLSKISKTGVATYFHYVLEAKLVTSASLSISLASEFIENTPGRDFQKQDCEQKVFVRLAAKIKKHFPAYQYVFWQTGYIPTIPYLIFVRKIIDNSLSLLQMEISQFLRPFHMFREM